MYFGAHAVPETFTFPAFSEQGYSAESQSRVPGPGLMKAQAKKDAKDARMSQEAVDEWMRDWVTESGRAQSNVLS